MPRRDEFEIRFDVTMSRPNEDLLPLWLSTDIVKLQVDLRYREGAMPVG